jgi:hypothetical protein
MPALFCFSSWFDGHPILIWGVPILPALPLLWVTLFRQNGFSRNEEIRADWAGINYWGGTIPWSDIDAIVFDRFVHVHDEHAEEPAAEANVATGIVVVCANRRLAFAPRDPETSQLLAEQLDFLRLKGLGSPGEVPSELRGIVETAPARLDEGLPAPAQRSHVAGQRPPVKEPSSS